MTNLTVIQTSLDPEQYAARTRRRPSIAARIGSMGQNRIGALLLRVATLAAMVWANVSLASYETFWETDLLVGVGDMSCLARCAGSQNASHRRRSPVKERSVLPGRLRPSPPRRARRG